MNNQEKIRMMDVSKLAYIGDAVYELYIRERFLDVKTRSMDLQNKLSVRYVKAESQAYAVKEIMKKLPEVELNLVKRARNHKITSKPQNLNPMVYKLATAFEAYIGYLYLSKDERLSEVIDDAVNIIDSGFESKKIEMRTRHE